MTPNLTPETLRALDQMTWTPAKMRAHAAAWKADRRRLAAAIAVIVDEDDPDAPGEVWLAERVLRVLRGDDMVALARPRKDP